MKTKISIAYSPDTDDAFMIYALKDRLIDWGHFDFEFIADDIQTLNEKALTSDYDITAVSMALYPHVADQYQLLPIGASIGDNFGPVVVVKEDNDLNQTNELSGLKIAVPGVHTSAYVAATELLPDFEAVPTPFDLIESKIKNGDVDAGVLIHELQLNFNKHGLKKVCDLGEQWNKRFSLPLPLGGIVIKRDLDDHDKIELHRIYRESIEYAFSNQTEVLAKASEWAKEGLNESLSEKYIDMYVNSDSLELKTSVRNGIEQLFRSSHEHGLSPEIGKAAILGDQV